MTLGSGHRHNTDLSKSHPRMSIEQSPSPPNDSAKLVALAKRRRAIQDENELAQMGKRRGFALTLWICSIANETWKEEVLKRRFGMISMLGFTTTLMATWEGVLAYFVSGLTNGGPAGLIWSFLIEWVGVLAVMACIAELSSMFPTSGGEYYWVFILAPASYRRFLSYLTGWISVAVWQAFVANSGFLCGTFIQGLITLNYPDTYSPHGWHGTLLFWATVVVAIITNTLLARWLPKIEGLILFLHIFGFFGILIPLVYTADHVAARDVFTQFLSSGGYSTIGLSFLIGMSSTTASLIGADCACHMVEEIHDASRVVPWNIMITMLVNGLLGFGMLIAALFCVGNIKQALETKTGYPFMEVFLMATNSTSGTTLMVCIPLILSFCAIVGQYATASRQMWAFARDRGLPFWKQLSAVHPRSTLPLWSIATTGAISCLIALINIGSTTALISIISFVTSTWLASVSIPLTLLLWKRVTGQIKSSAGFDSVNNLIDGNNLQWGKWRMTEPFGTIVNVFALAWVIVAFIFSFFPLEVPATAKSMNYSVLMTGFWVLFSVVFYMLKGRRVYRGPVIEIVAVQGHGLFRVGDDKL